MRRIMGVTAGVTMLATMAAAEDITATAQVYSRITAFAMPAGFAGVYENEANGSYLLELVPEGQTVEDWSEMITLSAAQGMAAQMPNPLDMAYAIGGGYQESCPDTYAGSDEGKQDIAGADAAHMVMFSCGDGGGYSESTMILVAVSGEDVFTLQWAERADVVQGQMQHDPEVWLPRMASLLSLRLCPVVEGEEPPYPSCLP